MKIQPTYTLLFTKFYNHDFKNAQEVIGNQDCIGLGSLALINALRRRYAASVRFLEEHNSICQDSTLETLEAQMLIASNTNILNNLLSAEELREQILARYPNAGFARLQKAESLMQKRNFLEAKRTILEVLKDFPDAKLLFMFLAQIELFLKNNLQAVRYVEKMPRGRLRSLYLFWSKFWYRHKFLSIGLTVLLSFAIRIFFPSNAALYVGSGLCFLFALYLLQYVKDRITPIWLIYLSVSLVVISFL